MSSTARSCYELINRERRQSSSRSRYCDNQTARVRYSAPHVPPHKPAINRARSLRIPRSWTNGNKQIPISVSYAKRAITQKAQKNKRHKKINLCLMCHFFSLMSKADRKSVV